MFFPEFLKAGEEEGSDASFFFLWALSLILKQSRKRRCPVLAATPFGLETD
jgi:hypothetical protein